MPTSDEPRAAPSPGAYTGHQMIELEWKALTEGSTKLSDIENDYCKQLGVAFGLERSWPSVVHERLTLPLRRTFQVGHFAQSSSASL